MRRSASEIIRNLERRIARLEIQASSPFINKAVKIVVDGSRGKFNSSEALQAIETHLDILSEEMDIILRSERDYDSFAKEQYRGNAKNLAGVADQYLRG